MNLVPGATPAQFQNAEIDTPGRSLRTWVNGTQPNSNATRIDGAVSVNIWLPHHVGYVQPAETIETVNVADQQLRRRLRHGRRRRLDGHHQVGHQRAARLGVLVPQPGRVQREHVLQQRVRPPEGRPLSRNIYGGTLGGPVVQNKLFYFGSVERYQETPRLAPEPTPCRPRRCATATSARWRRPTRPSASTTRSPAAPAASAASEFAELHDPVEHDQPDRAEGPGASTRCRTRPRDLNSNQILDDYSVRCREVRVDRDNYDTKLTWQRSAPHSIWGKFAMLDAEVIDNFIARLRRGQPRRHRASTSPPSATPGRSARRWSSTATSARTSRTRRSPGPTSARTTASTSASRASTTRTTSAPAACRHFDATATDHRHDAELDAAVPQGAQLHVQLGADQGHSRSHDLRLGRRRRAPRAEPPPGGVRRPRRLRGGFAFSGTTTGAPGYTPLAWNQLRRLPPRPAVVLFARTCRPRR